MIRIQQDEALALAVSKAIREGDVQALEQLLIEHPELTSASIQDLKGGLRTLLHIATDWPGHFPNGAAVVRLLIQHGCDPNAGKEDEEKPLHWAASSDDVEVIDALLDGGASLEATGAVIAGGTPLEDAVAFGQFNAARRLVERGAKTQLWHAAALGLLSQVQSYFVGPGCPTSQETNAAFWQACRGGQRETAEYLLAQGADLNWIPDWTGQTGQTPFDIALVENPGRPPAPGLVEWLKGLGAKTASELK